MPMYGMKLARMHPWLKYCNVYMNHDPVMTLTKFMARSTWVTYAFEWEKLLKCHLNGKSQQEIGKRTEYCFFFLKKENGPRASSAPALGLNTIIFKQVYWYRQQMSGEHLQDHCPLVNREFDKHVCDV